MRNALKRLAIVLGLACAAAPAFAQSTINTSVPAPNAPLKSAPILNNFVAAASDINGIISGHPAANLAGCPSTPAVFEDCLVVSGSPYLWYKWTGNTGNWGLIGSVEPSTGLFSFALNAGNVSGTSPIAVTFPGGVATIGLATGAGLTVSGGNLVVQPVTINSVSCQPGSSCTITATAASITVGATTVLSGTPGRVLYDNAGVLGEATVTGSLGSVVLSASPTLTGTISAVNVTLSGVLKAGATSSFNANAAAVPPGIGSVPILVLQGADAAGGNGVTIYNHSDGAELYLAASLGTGASPTLVTSGTRLGRIYGYGFDGTNYDQATRISFAATQDFSPTHNGAQILFYTTPNNSTTKTLALTIDQDQSLAAIGPVSASNLSLGGKLTTSAALTTTGTTTPTLAFPSTFGLTYTFPAVSTNLAYQTGVFTSGHCLQASGTAGGIADAGASCGSGSTSITANSTPTSGFSAGRFVYSDGSLAQATAGVTYNGVGQVTNALGTITATTRALTLTATFNNSGAVIGAPLLINVTNTASEQGSTIADFQVGGNSVMAIYTQDGTAGGLSAPQVLINAGAPSGQAPFTGDWSTHKILDVQGLGGIISHAYNGQIAQFIMATLGGSTLSSPTAMTSGQQIGALLFKGSDGVNTATQQTAQIGVITTELWSGTAIGAFMDFAVTATGTTTRLSQMRLQASGGLTVGNAVIATDPGAGNLLLGGNLQLTGSSSGAATVQAPASGGGTAMLFAGSDTIAGKTVANGGTNCSSASGTCLDNITGFSSTGLLNRTGAGAFSFVSLGTGVATALGVSVGSAGAPVVNGGALGTPSSGNGANLTGVVKIFAQSSVESTVHTGDTSLTTLVTIAVPGNTLGANGRLRITALYRFVGTAGAKTPMTSFGGTTFGQITTASGVLSLKMQTELANRNATNSQVGGPTVNTGGWAVVAAVDYVTAGIDTTTSQNILLQGQLANSGDSIAVESYLVELIN